MSCCTNTYNLGCLDHCGVVSFGSATVGGTYIGVFQSGNTSIKQTIILNEGDPFIFDLSLLNEQSDYTLTLYHDGAQISLTIDEIEYDCFRVKTEILGISTGTVSPTFCTPMCEEIYDPTQVGADVFDYNNLHTYAAVDGVSITGDGTTGNPFVSVGGGGTAIWGGITGTLSDQTDLQTELDAKVDENVAIVGDTKTKITYDSKGLVTAGANATTADIIDTVNKRYVTDADLVVLSNTSGTNSGNETATTIGALINASTAATPNNTDLVATAESAGLLKKITWTNVKAFLKTYFDTLYPSGSGTSSGTNTGDNATNTTSNSYADGKVTDAIVDGVLTVAPSQNAVFDALAGKENTITGGATSITTADLLTSRALVSDGSGKVTTANTTSTEIAYLFGVTGSVQTQLNGKQAAYTILTTLGVLANEAGVLTNNGSGVLSWAASGGTALSSITAATGTNTINNGAFQQEWTWNSINNNSGFKLSSTSAGGGTGTTHKLFESIMSGALTNTGTVSYAGYFKNTQTVGAGVGLYAEGAIVAINAVGVVTSNQEFNIGGTSATRWRNSGGANIFQTDQASGFIFANNVGLYRYMSYSLGSVYFSLANVSTSRQTLIFKGDYFGASFRAEDTTVALIERNAGKLIFSASTGESGGYAAFTPKNIMTVQGGATEALGNVGIGTTSPVASAKLELSSTTQGFLPPRMTKTQREAIASPSEGLMVYDTVIKSLFIYDSTNWIEL